MLRDISLLLPLSELIKSKILHLRPQVSLTCMAFDLWFFGFVMIQHNTRTSLVKLVARDTSLFTANEFCVSSTFFLSRSAISLSSLFEFTFSFPTGYRGWFFCKWPGFLNKDMTKIVWLEDFPDWHRVVNVRLFWCLPYIGFWQYDFICSNFKPHICTAESK